MNIAEYIRDYYGQANRNGTRISLDEVRYDPSSTWSITYQDDNDDDWEPFHRRNYRLFIDEWREYFEQVSLSKLRTDFVEVVEPKDFGEFSASGASIQSLFEPDGVTYEE